MDQTGALRAIDALQKQLALEFQGFVKRQVQTGLHRLDHLERREQAA